MALSNMFPVHKKKTREAEGLPGGRSRAPPCRDSRLTFHRGQDEERHHGVVQAARGLGDAGQHGERIQKVTMGRAHAEHQKAAFSLPFLASATRVSVMITGALPIWIFEAGTDICWNKIRITRHIKKKKRKKNNFFNTLFPPLHMQ